MTHPINEFTLASWLADHGAVEVLRAVATLQSDVEPETSGEIRALASSLHANCQGQALHAHPGAGFHEECAVCIGLRDIEHGGAR